MNCDLILNLANSLWFLNHKQKDVLKDDNWINAHLNHTGARLTSTPTSTFTNNLKRVRNSLVEILEGACIENHIDFFNQCLEKALFYNRLTISDDKPILQRVHATSHEDRLIADIIIELIDAVDKDLILKIRKCGVPDCQFFFLDKSKNQNKKYCSVQCNNVAKVRRFRQKHKN